MSNINLDAAKKLRLTDIKKQSRYAWQVELELDCLHDQILIFTIFVKYSYRIYNNEKITKNIKVR